VKSTKTKLYSRRGQLPTAPRAITLGAIDLRAIESLTKVASLRKQRAIGGWESLGGSAIKAPPLAEVNVIEVEIM
jgi:hypothetical protein